MSLNSDNLIEKFANLLEEGENLDPSAFAESAIEIIAMLSVEPDLNNTLIKINAKLHSLFQNAELFQLEAMEMGMPAKFRAAKEIRDLKRIPYTATALIH